jgi:hypothetical protein
MDNIKSLNIPPSTTLKSILIIASFLSQQVLDFAGCCHKVIYHPYPGGPKAKMLQAVKKRLL